MLPSRVNATEYWVTHSDIDRAFDAAVFVRQMLQQGFTSARDVGGGDDSVALRNAINSGLPIIECPELYAAVQEGDDIDIDLSGSIQHQRRSIQFPTFPDSVRELLELGGLAEYLKAQQKKLQTS